MAAELSPDPDSMTGWQRRIFWLEQLYRAGEFDQVRRLGEKWALTVPVALRGQLNALRANVPADLEATCALLAEAYEDLAGRDPARAADIATYLGGRLMVRGRIGEARGPLAAAIAQARTAGDPVALRTALGADGLRATLAGEPDAGDRLRAAVRLPGFADTPFPYFAPETYLSFWHLWRGELNPARDLLQAVAGASERHGSEESAELAKFHLADLEWRAGNWDTATAYAAENARWDRETGHGEGGTAYAVSLVEAGRGNVEHARKVAAEGMAQAEAQGDWAWPTHCRWVLALAELSADDPAAALRWLEPVADALQDRGIGEPGVCFFTPDLIEAWAATGQLDRAAGRLAWLHEAARRLDHPWARITAGRAEAAVKLAEGNPAAAVRAVAAVIGEARERGLPFELGRCLLDAGHRAAQSPPAPRRHRLTRRGRGHLRSPGRAAVAGAGPGAAGPAGPRPGEHPDAD